MLHMLHHEDELMIYFDQRQPEPGPPISEVHAFIADSNVDNLSSLEWWNKKKNYIHNWLFLLENIFVFQYRVQVNSCAKSN